MIICVFEQLVPSHLIGHEMTTIIAILNSKGGSGKSTLAINLCHSLHQRGCSTLLVDTDPQGSAKDWHDTTEENPLTLISMATQASLKGLPSIAKQYDFVVVDGESKVQDKVSVAIKLADVILIPCQPSPFDLWACDDLADLIKTRQDITDGKPKAAFVITRAVQHTKLSGEIAQALTGYGLPAFKQQIKQRQAYPQVSSQGLSIFDSGNAEAISEFEALTSELLAFNEQENNYVGSETAEA
jgi:chromosome partitioning protein